MSRTSTRAPSSDPLRCPSFLPVFLFDSLQKKTIKNDLHLPRVMCGIIGAFNRENASQIVREGLAIIRERGRDGYGHYDGKHLAHAESVDDLPFTASPSIVGHALHAIVDVIPEPIKDGDGVLSANCEIYNWKELSKKHD